MERVCVGRFPTWDWQGSSTLQPWQEFLIQSGKNTNRKINLKKNEVNLNINELLSNLSSTEGKFQLTSRDRIFLYITYYNKTIHAAKKKKKKFKLTSPSSFPKFFHWNPTFKRNLTECPHLLNCSKCCSSIVERISASQLLA